MTDLLLEATGVAKRYGAVAALRDASLSVAPGEVHALLGANGAGKSTFVKILTGAIHPDAGTIRVRGTDRLVRSPAEARRAGIVSVYQEPSLVPDLEVAENLRLTETPIPAFRRLLGDLGISELDLRAYVRELPLPTLRVIDLARALAAEPDLLLLDEMTAALPADLTERVLDVVGKVRESGRSVIFISHRMLEIASLCDRATVLRDGETVGVLDVTKGAEERIVGLMLGPVAADVAEGGATIAAAASAAAEATSGKRTRGPGRRGSRGGRRGGAILRARGCGSRGCRPARSSTTSRSSSAPARSWASWRSRDRVRTSCSKCSPALARRPREPSSSMAPP